MNQIMKPIKSLRWQTFLLIILVASIGILSEGCKTSGKMSKKERKALIEQAKQKLRPIANGTTTLSFEEQERVINEIINQNLNDPEVNSLIIQANQRMKAHYAEQEKLKKEKIDAARVLLYDMLVNKDNKSADELEKGLNAIKAQNLGDPEIDELIGRVEKKIAEMRSSGGNLPITQQLSNNFQGIVNASKAGNTTQVSSLRAATLKLFASESVPVLIIISKEGNMIDYDKPTTIGRYLDFLKDQKDNRNNVDTYQLDSNGKIRELDLIKK